MQNHIMTGIEVLALVGGGYFLHKRGLNDSACFFVVAMVGAVLMNFQVNTRMVPLFWVGLIIFFLGLLGQFLVAHRRDNEFKRKYGSPLEVLKE